MKIAQIIIRRYSEKSVRGEAMNKYSFYVAKDATKIDVKSRYQNYMGLRQQSEHYKRLQQIQDGKNRYLTEKI